jgi:DNA-binding transcriptional MerR regulator
MHGEDSRKHDMRIAEAASKSGLSIDTIRYYEKSGLVPEIRRGSDGHRRFSPEQIEWLTLLYWLRKTGMPMQTMRRFASLYHDGDTTISERKEVLLAHSERLKRRRAELDSCEEILARKIAIYREFEDESRGNCSGRKRAGR